MKVQLCILLLVIGIFDPVAAQIKNPVYFPPKFELSVFMGGSFGKTVDQIESAMIEAGFGGKVEDFLFGTTEYPHYIIAPVFDIEGIYYFNPHWGLTLNIASAENVEITGNDEVVNFLKLKSKASCFALGMSYRINSFRHQFTLAPCYIEHGIKDIGHGNPSPNVRNDKIGIYAAYNFRVLNKTNWFLTLKTNLRWSSATSIGPYTKEYTYPINQVTKTSVFPKTDIDFFLINIGVSIGLYPIGKPFKDYNI